MPATRHERVGCHRPAFPAHRLGESARSDAHFPVGVHQILACARRNSHFQTHRFHGILLLMLLNKFISPSYVLENTMKAFFKMSRSSPFSLNWENVRLMLLKTPGDEWVWFDSF